ncbi:uncharacterized protein LOC111019876 [Momordica charantia]|uniref:Uncharacterized protein LOC111019876 n=1 Tax=Momordica charantia TaxID=3673 RepID=A0A6J1DCX6_MOMCH|nr:uncharacterized protein LOC111019876 [Momordica charantia]XP_022152073.1 uncharacterized protein LOC111019876 [Momordica charantia]XP_022152075.1 uncharacterized protein LOC111019876 [Momordica charantia]
MFKDFKRRLRSDLKKIMDGRILASETRLGGKAKVSIRLKKLGAFRRVISCGVWRILNNKKSMEANDGFRAIWKLHTSNAIGWSLVQVERWFCLCGCWWFIGFHRKCVFSITFIFIFNYHVQRFYITL